jgi:hypothetical protein
MSGGDVNNAVVYLEKALYTSGGCIKWNNIGSEDMDNE